MTAKYQRQAGCDRRAGSKAKRAARALQNFERLPYVHAASDRTSRVSKSAPARSDRAVARVRECARRRGASDLETDRTGAERFRADADADRQLCGLSAA